MKSLKQIVFAVTALSTLALGEQAQTVTTTQTASIQATGLIDVRPTWDTKTGVLRTENSIEAGAKLSPTVSLSYLQAVNTNIYDPTVEEGTGLGAKLDVGFVRVRVKDILKAGDATLSYQGRVYLPVNESAANKGQILANRNYLNLSYKMSNVASVTLSEIPILFVNNKAGVGKKANTVFENRVYLTTDLQFTEKLSLSVPVMFHQTRYGNFGGASNSSTWDYYVWINPELAYALTDTYSVGAAFYNQESFLTSDLSKFQIGTALESGAVQLFFAASL